jgi:predicted ABC-type ATPase
MANGQPQVIVLAGPNGCGKTTSSQQLLAVIMVRQRYERSMRNFFSLYRGLVDSWYWYDNSQPGQPRPGAQREGGDEAIADVAVLEAIRAKVNP